MLEERSGRWIAFGRRVSDRLVCLEGRVIGRVILVNLGGDRVARRGVQMMAGGGVGWRRW